MAGVEGDVDLPLSGCRCLLSQLTDPSCSPRDFLQTVTWPPPIVLHLNTPIHHLIRYTRAFSPLLQPTLSNDQDLSPGTETVLLCELKLFCSLTNSELSTASSPYLGTFALIFKGHVTQTVLLTSGASASPPRPTAITQITRSSQLVPSQD